MKAFGGLTLFLGIVAIVGALVVSFVVVPSMRVFPEDVDTTREYDVPSLTLLNETNGRYTFDNYTGPAIPIGMAAVEAPPAPEASAPEAVSTAEAAPEVTETDSTEGDTEMVGGAPSQALPTNPELHIRRTVKVEAVDGNKTLIRETQGFYADNAATEPIREVVKYHALDRASLEFLAAGDIPDDWKAKEGFAQREGLVIGWGPEGVRQEDYTGWSDDYNATVVLEYVDEQEHNGINTYHFRSSSEPQLIAPEYAALLGLPDGIAAGAFLTLVRGLDSDAVELTTAQSGALGTLVLTALGNVYNDKTSVPLIYYYDYTAEYWVEPTSGVLIDTYKHERRVATLPEEVMVEVEKILSEDNPQNLPINVLRLVLPIPVNEFEYQARQTSQDDAKADAEDAKSTIDTFGTTVPMGLGVVGALMIVGGGYMFARGGKDEGDKHITKGRPQEVKKR